MAQIILYDVGLMDNTDTSITNTQVCKGLNVVKITASEYNTLNTLLSATNKNVLKSDHTLSDLTLSLIQLLKLNELTVKITVPPASDYSTTYYSLLSSIFNMQIINNQVTGLFSTFTESNNRIYFRPFTASYQEWPAGSSESSKHNTGAYKAEYGGNYYLWGQYGSGDGSNNDSRYNTYIGILINVDDTAIYKLTMAGYYDYSPQASWGSLISGGLYTNLLIDEPYYTEDRTTVTELPSGSATWTVSTEGTLDTVTISVNEGYVLNSVALYDPTDRLVNRWKELPEGGVIQVRRDQPGEWKLRITCQEILSPYNPTVPIEDLPSDTITPTYPTDYIGKYIGAGFYKLFIPTVTQLNAFVNYLYTQTFIDAIMQLWNKMLGIEEMIVGVNIIPGAPTVAGTAIPKVGWVSMTESQAMNYTTQQYLEIDLGSLTVSRAWGNYLDFAPYTKISIYLPFIGERTLDTNDVMGKTLNVRYHIDLLSGNCVAYVYVGGSIHYQFSGNCAYSIPISSADTANLFLQPLKAIAGMTLAGVGVATGNPMAIAAGHALGATVGSDESGAFVSPPSAEISAPDVRKVDGLNANTGYMGTIRPYLSIERVKPDINDGFGAEIGYQSNKFRTLGNLAGFTKVSEVHLEGITATTAELTQIEAMLKEGVII